MTTQPIDVTAVDMTQMSDDPPSGFPATGEGTKPETSLVHAVPVEPSRADRAIEHAAHQAWESSGIPGHDEFLALAAQAHLMSTSGIVPKALQGKPADVFVILLTGRDLGIPITSAINQIHVIDGRPTLAPKLLNARLQRLGLGKIVPGERTDMKATAIAMGPHGEVLGETTFTWEEAITGGLVMPDCLPGNHTEKCMRYASKGYEKCRQGYKTWPQRMLWWRAAGWAADDFFPEASLGLYSPEEMGAITDDDGNPIDPGTAPLPPGFEQQAIDSGVDDPPNDPADTALMRATIAALPPDAQADLKSRWAERNIAPLAQLTQGPARFVWAMIRPLVDAAKKAGTMGDVVVGEPPLPGQAPNADGNRPPLSGGIPSHVEAESWAQTPQDPPGPDGGPDAAPEPDTATGAESAPDPGMVVESVGEPMVDLPVSPTPGTVITAAPIVNGEVGEPRIIGTVTPPSVVDSAIVHPVEPELSDEDRAFLAAKERAMRATSIMPGRVVDAALGARQLVKTGNLDVRRERLADQMAIEECDPDDTTEAPF